MPLTDPRTSPLAALAAADFAALVGAGGTTGEAGVEAVYRPKGAGAGKLVTIAVVGKPDGPVAPDRASVPGPDRPSNAYIVQVARRRIDEALTDAGGGVGDFGGVVQLTVGDTFTVPASAVGRADKAEAVLRVGANIRLVEHSIWRCEAMGA